MHHVITKAVFRVTIQLPAQTPFDIFARLNTVQVPGHFFIPAERAKPVEIVQCEFSEKETFGFDHLWSQGLLPA
jgi:hypothetical protein